MRISPAGLSATGVQVGTEPVPYRVEYALEAPGLVTTSLVVTASGDGWTRRLDLRHDGRGTWSWERTGAAPSGEDVDAAPSELLTALDCDLGLSPLTNAMPALRDGLHRSGSRDYVMAWVSVPDLVVIAYPQRYEHVSHDGTGSVVRFTDLLTPGSFTSDLVYDASGLVRDYPGLATRTAP